MKSSAFLQRMHFGSNSTNPIQVEFRNLQRTELNGKALWLLINKFSKLSKPNVIVSFDNRLTEYGFYRNQKKHHHILISSRRLTYLDSVCQAYTVIDTLLHELQHAMQREQLGTAFCTPKYSRIKGTKHEYFNYYYSPIEIEARVYADTNIREAIKFYEQQQRAKV